MKLHFRENLIYLRKKQGYSQIELANEIGCARGALAAWEEGRSMAKVENLIQLSSLFGLTLEALLQKDVSEGVELPDLSVEERLAKIEHFIYLFMKDYTLLNQLT